MEQRTGRQEPTALFVLPYRETRGPKAVALYELTGKKALEWQQGLIYDILAVNDNGQWTHTKCGYEIPRQNGKGEVILMRELYGLVTGERILHTAHRVTTSHSAFERLCKTLDSMGLEKDKDYSSIKAKGQERIELIGGGVVEFRTRTATGGLGESYDLLVIDEAQEYQSSHETALKYVISASKNPQTIMCGTPPTAVSSGTVFVNFRDDVMTGSGENSYWAEWSVPELSDINDVDLWYETNPSLGYTLSERTIRDEIGQADDVKIDFNIQRLGVWLKYNQKSIISKSAWDALNVLKLPALTGKMGVGIKYNKDGETVSMAIAVRTTDGKVFVEAVNRKAVREGNVWITDWLRKAGNNVLKVVVDGANGQMLLEEAMVKERLGKPVCPKVKEIIAANQAFEEAIYQQTMCHMDQPSVTAVISNCQHRAIGSAGGFGFQPLNEMLDISLMDSLILAHYAVITFKEQKQFISY
ncbi:MAG: terminase [Oscillospiraceae bacterium]|nr:terminase [Oscillospiraceae bacterium]